MISVDDLISAVESSLSSCVLLTHLITSITIFSMYLGLAKFTHYKTQTNVPATGGPLATKNEVICIPHPIATGTFGGLTHVIRRTLSVVENKPSQNPYITMKITMWT